MCVKLHEGKRYVCRNGAVVGPLEKNPRPDSDYPFMCDVDPKKMGGLTNASWTEEGVWCRGYNEDDYDIVAEYHEYVWKWMVPDKPGVWALGGLSRNIPGCAFSIKNVIDPENHDAAWYCFLMDLPQIQMPPKQRVTKRLWLKDLKAMPPVYGVSVYEERWISAESPIPSQEWISTNVTKEFEE